MRKICKINERQLDVLKRDIVQNIFTHSNLKSIHEDINEELGINDDVRNATEALYNTTRSHIKELINGDEVELQTSIGDIDNINVYIKQGEEPDGNTLYIQKRDVLHISVSISVVIINNKIDWDSFNDTVQHEFNHVLEQNRNQNPYRPKTSGLILNNIYSADKDKQALAIIAYISDPFEQRGMINGMYAYIRQCKADGNMPVKMENIDACNQLKKLCYAKQYLAHNKDSQNMMSALKEYEFCKWNIRKFMTRAQDGIDSLKKRILRTAWKCKKDGLDDNGYVFDNEQYVLSEISNMH